jgi:hypothetical protein
MDRLLISTRLSTPATGSRLLPDRFSDRPIGFNGGIAALETDIVIDSLKIELSQGEQFGFRADKHVAPHSG